MRKQAAPRWRPAAFRGACQRAELNSGALAARLGLDPSTVRRWWCKGAAGPKSRALRVVIAQILGVPLSKLEGPR